MDLEQILQLGPWTFRRSLQPLFPLSEGEELKASWRHGDYYFGVWEPENPDQAEIRKSPYIHPKLEADFFQILKGAPVVRFVQADHPRSWLEQTTPAHLIYEWVAAKKPTTFQTSSVLFHSSLRGYKCLILTQIGTRTLEMVLGDLLGRDALRRFPQSAPHGQAMKAKRVCDKVAGQLVNAILEMSTWTENQVCGVDGGLPPDGNLAEQCFLQGRPWSRDHIVRNLEYAGLDHCNTVFTPGIIEARNIVVDHDNNFLGFVCLDAACFAPRNWVMVTLIGPAAEQESDVSAFYGCDLEPSESTYIPKDGPDSILLLWGNALSSALVANGYEPLNPRRLPWLRNRSPSMMKYTWWEIEGEMKRRGKSSWKELVPKSERDCWWYNHTPTEQLEWMGSRILYNVIHTLATIFPSVDPELPMWARC